MATTRALVLGGGGIAGVAWEVGLLAGLARAGIDVARPDLVIGTSAGSLVGSQLAGGIGLEPLLETQLAAEPPGEPAGGPDRAADFDGEALLRLWGDAFTAGGTDEEVRARIGAAALAARPDASDGWVAFIGERLATREWRADPRLLITAVDADSGAVALFEQSSGVPLAVAVASSCAVPGVWPPVTIGRRRYMDGGVRSVTNADLAAGADRVLVVAPFVVPSGGPLPGIEDEVAVLEKSGRAVVVAADGPSLAAFGSNPLDPATRVPSARAGLAQAAAVATEVAALWTI